jgi:hypothetical protein
MTVHPPSRPLGAVDARRPLPAFLPPPWAGAWATWVQTGFDAVRHQHALAVRAGWTRSSLLASARLEQQLASAERTLLGRLARRV